MRRDSWFILVFRLKKVLLDDILTKIQSGFHPVEFLRLVTAPSHSDFYALSSAGFCCWWTFVLSGLSLEWHVAD